MFAQPLSSCIYLLQDLSIQHKWISEVLSIGWASSISERTKYSTISPTLEMTPRI